MSSDAIRMTVKAFFDKPAIMAKMDAARRRALSKAGAFVRRDARASIRKSKNVSRPGAPPRSHQGDLRKFLFFSYDPVADSVVVGPVRVSKIGQAPQALEHGGTSTIMTGPKGKRRRRTITIAARPFMGPALEKNRSKIPEAFLNSVR
jgi:hypothetical protein